MASNKTADYQPMEPPNLFARMLQENPLALGLIALALGAIVGILLPETRKENELMGSTRDELLDRGREVVGDLTHRAGAVVETAQSAAQEALTKAQSAAVEALGDAKTAATEAISEVVDSVKEEAKHQNLVPNA